MKRSNHLSQPYFLTPILSIEQGVDVLTGLTFKMNRHFVRETNKSSMHYIAGGHTHLCSMLGARKFFEEKKRPTAFSILYLYFKSIDFKAIHLLREMGI